MMRRSLLARRMVVGAAAVALIALVILIASDRPVSLWPLPGASADLDVRTTYVLDYEADVGQVIVGRRGECVISWPTESIPVWVRDQMMRLGVDDGAWVWSGSERAWRTIGLPVPCGSDQRDAAS